MTDDELERELAALRQLGAARLEPVRLHHIEVLAQRASPHQGTVRRLLDAKLANALRLLKARCESAQGAPPQALVMTVAPKGQAALTELIRHAAHQAQDKGAVMGTGGTTQAPGQRPVLPAAHYFRNTWSKLSVDKRVTQALARGPQNAGPLNAHMLVLRSLAQLRDISPDYVNRFTAYVDTLLCLDQWERGQAAQGKATTDVAGKPKPKPKPKPTSHRPSRK